MKTIRFSLPFVLGVVVLVVGRLLSAQDASNWNDDVQRVLSEAEKRLQSTASGEAWDTEIQGALVEAVRNLKATSTGKTRGEDIQGVLTKAAERLQSVKSGEARAAEVQKIFSEVSTQLRGSGERLSANAGAHAGWNDEVQGILSETGKRLTSTASGEAWDNEIRGALSEASKRLKATSTGQTRGDEIQGALAKVAERLQSVGSGDARAAEVQKILGEATSQLRGSGERLSANAGAHAGWNDEVQGAISQAGKRLNLTATGEAWDTEIQGALIEAVRNLKATPTGQTRAGEIQGILTQAAERLQSVGTGDSRAAEVQKILSEASTQLRGSGERLSATGAEHVGTTPSLSAAEKYDPATDPQAPAAPPKITPIKGGYYVEWANLTDIGGVKLTGPMTGKLEVTFDNRLEDVGAEPKQIDNPDVLVPLADFWIVRGKPERAIPLYERGLKAKPDDVLFQNNLAMIYSTTMKDNEGALNIINAAMKKDQADNVILLDSKGLVLMNDSRPDEAIPVLERCVELSCQRPIYVMHLAKALDTVGRTSSAKDWFNKVLPDLESGANHFSPDNKDMFDYLRMKYAN